MSSTTKRLQSIIAVTIACVAWLKPHTHSTDNHYHHLEDNHPVHWWPVCWLCGVAQTLSRLDTHPTTWDVGLAGLLCGLVAIWRLVPSHTGTQDRDDSKHHHHHQRHKVLGYLHCKTTLVMNHFLADLVILLIVAKFLSFVPLVGGLLSYLTCVGAFVNLLRNPFVQELISAPDSPSCDPWTCSWKTNGTSTIIVNFYHRGAKIYVASNKDGTPVRPMCIHHLWKEVDAFYKKKPSFLSIKIFDNSGWRRKFLGKCVLQRGNLVPVTLAAHHKKVIWKVRPLHQPPPEYKP